MAHKVAIIGSSSSLTTVKAGKFIDSCDLVVKINWVLLKPFPVENGGTKIDVWGYGLNKALYHPFINSYHKKGIYNIGVWWAISKSHYEYKKWGTPKDYEAKILQRYIPLFKFAIPTWDARGKIVLNGITRPTTGLIMLVHAVINYPDSEIYFGGFGMPRKRFTNFMDEAHEWRGHDIHVEDLYIEQLEKLGKLRRLEHMEF